MWEVSPEDVERVLAALINLDLGQGVEGIARAALHVMQERCAEREREQLEEASWEPPILEESDEGQEEASRAGPGVPVTSPQEELSPCPTGGILPGWAQTSRDCATQTQETTRPSLQAPRARQPEEEEDPPCITWEEVHQVLEHARNLERMSQKAWTTAFSAFKKWCGAHTVPQAPIKRFSKLIEDKEEELRHTENWLEERKRERQLKAEEEEKAKHLARAELEAARPKRWAQEQAFAGARFHLEEVRRRERESASVLGKRDGAGEPTVLPSTRWVRYCPICGRPGAKDARRCPDRAKHPPRSDKVKLSTIKDKIYIYSF